MNYREMLGIGTLGSACGVEKGSRNQRQKKAIKNIKYCANDQWGYVNSWYDEKDEYARDYLLNARDLFSTIYKESQSNVYDEGSCYFGNGVSQYLKDIRFCGKEFLQRVAFYYTVKLLEECVPEVDGTDEDAERVYNDLVAIKRELGI